MTEICGGVTHQPCFKLKGGAFTLPTLQLLASDLSCLAEQLQDKVKQAPKFFDQTPVVIDLNQLADGNVAIDLEFLLAQLTKHCLIPIGIRSKSDQHHKLAKKHGLAIFPEGRASTNSSTNTPEVVRNKVKIISQPIRSGQQVYAQGGDLVILSSVSAGAELLADGHIHVYGSLRGRALAGILGDVTARIFCLSLEAELVSIAGHYRVSEHLKDALWRQSAMIHLDNGNLRVGIL